MPAVPGDPSKIDHDDVLAITKPQPGINHYPRFWQQSAGCDRVVSAPVKRGLEYELVTGYFLKTLQSRDGVRFLGLQRLQNPTVWKRFQRHVSEHSEWTVMFHGCKTQANEDSILRYGFQVSSCISGGRGYGTWFAHAASYSNSGYVFTDLLRVRHIFVCLVSSVKKVVLNNPTMRVVGQDHAYPLWLLKYEILQPSWCPCRPQVVQSPVLAAASPIEQATTTPQSRKAQRRSRKAQQAKLIRLHEPEGQPSTWKFQASRRRVKAWKRWELSDGRWCWARARHV